VDERSRRAIALLAAAAVLGWLADALFVGQRPGLNVFLFAACFVAALAFVLRIGGAPLHQGRRWMALPLLLFSAAFAWHDSRLLVATNLLALAGALSLGALRRKQPKPQEATLADYAGGFVSAGVGALAGSVELLERDVPWREVGKSLGWARSAAAARALALGVPLLALFGGLFLAADAVFRRLVTGVVPTGFPDPWPDAVVVVGVAWAAAGLLRDLAADRDEARLVPPGAIAASMPAFRLGGLEVAIVLAALDVLFLAFVAVQARYLFGGSDVVLEHAHLTYAEYARHGFFDLLAVTALVVPVVLAACAVARDRLPLVRALCAVLVGLELVVAASALQRMHVYVQQYGLTQLRLYAVGVILWLAVVLAWAVPTILRGRGRRFAVGAVVAGFVATAVLNVADPDALIARTDLGRSQPDAAYVLTLGADAVPVLVDRLPQIRDPALRRRVAATLLRRDFGGGALAWNASRSRARALVERHRAELELLAGR
jgi:hypothetical protein